MDVAVEPAESLLAVPVDVVGEREPGLLHGLEERAEQGALGLAAFEDERAGAAAPGVGALETGLYALEVGEAVGVVPGLHAGVRGPALVVHGVAALEDHAVDARGPAEHLAAGVGEAATVHVRLGLGLVLPVVQGVAHRKGNAAGM